MTRLYVVVEGASEEAFVTSVLGPSLYASGVYVAPRLIGKPGHKGGIISYQRALGDVLKVLKEDTGAFCTTMFDYYGLPRDFPGLSPHAGASSLQRVEAVEKAFYEEVRSNLVDALRPDRFIPYIQLHEYEGLLFSDPEQIDAVLSAYGNASSLDALRAIGTRFQSPEDIDDGQATAPSKRLLALYPTYQKVTFGVQIAEKIGLLRIRQKCPHFNSWVIGLELLSHR